MLLKVFANRRSLAYAPNVLIVAMTFVALPATAHAQKVRLKDGRILSGAMMTTSGVADNPDSMSGQSGEISTKSILLIDDELRRIFIPKLHLAEVMEQAADPWVKITPWQQPSQGAGKLISVGPALAITPFDEYGRRIYEMQLGDGPLSVVQGITELTPYYAKVEALIGPKRSIAWDMRLATSSIPHDTIAAILTKSIPQDDPRKRLEIVRFYIQGKRFPDARRELERIIEEFPEMKDLNNQLRILRQMSASQLLDELKLRRTAGQHKLVEALLTGFPVDGVAGETLIEVREVTAAYEQDKARIKKIGDTLRDVVNQISDPDNRGLAAPLAEEVIRELSFNTAERLAPFVQLLDDSSLTSEEKAALAISGWLLGRDDAVRDLSVAISLVKVRDAVIRYLREPLARDRQLVFESMQSMEGASVEQLAKLIARMKPPWHDPQQAADADGYLELSAPGQTEDGDFAYYVQLPAEYDPYRRYPTLIVLNGVYNTPVQELDFWAGSPPPAVNGLSIRRGQAMRNGYITIAVDWQKPHQYQYEYSAREHIAVLTCLRDASRRFSIDADRTFLSGHDIGGEAAWDMAQAHPDLWAGTIPFGPAAEDEQKYRSHYRENAEFVPLYFVVGELDGRTIADNAPLWNKYLRAPRFDMTLVEYQGRGHEPFHDEILELFTWMSLKRRGPPPAEFQCRTLRPWDNFFWWLECDQFPPNFMVHPADWSGRITPARIGGRHGPDNRLMAESSADKTTIWLNPDIVDFSKPMRISLGSRKLATGESGVKPDALVLLEDVRTRADRQRPFWAKIEVP